MSIKNMADTDGRRNEKQLTKIQYEEAKDYAVSLGMPEERIRYDEDCNTCYLGGGIDCLTIGTDVLPLGNRSKNPNDNITLRGAIAHEIVGHRESSLKGRAINYTPLDEAQASIRAARFAPNLSSSEKMDLARDGIMRLKNVGLSLRDIKNKLFINER